MVSIRRDVPLWSLILPVTIVALISVYICCFYRRWVKQKEEQKEQESEFEAAISSARRRVEESARCCGEGGDRPAASFETLEGDFDLRYTDTSSELRMRLRRNDDWLYEIEGGGSDANRSIIKIEEGLASRSGLAYWVEEKDETESTYGFHLGQKVLTEGRFDFESDEFSGTWRTDAGVTGTYASVRGSGVTKTYLPAVEVELGRMVTVELEQ